MRVEQIVAQDLALTANTERCIRDRQHLIECLTEWMDEIDLDEITNNLRMIQHVVENSASKNCGVDSGEFPRVVS